MDGGDGGNFDGCECIWNQELATRRLINMIRQSQDYCTENECYTDSDTGAGSPDPTGSTAMFFIGFWFLMALVLFFLRPKSSVPASKNNRQRDGSGPSFDPPPSAST